MASSRLRFSFLKFCGWPEVMLHSGCCIFGLMLLWRMQLILIFEPKSSDQVEVGPSVNFLSSFVGPILTPRHSQKCLSKLVLIMVKRSMNHALLLGVVIKSWLYL